MEVVDIKYNFDFHFHSCLSPCGDAAMTPATLAGMGKLAGLDLMALTDHNSCGNCRAFCAAAEHYGLVGVPGMELCTLEEVHVICLFPDVDAAEGFSALVEAHLPPLPNDPAIFGPQVLMDREDHVVGEEKRMLAGATDIGIYEAAPLVAQYGGVAFPAHVDRPSFSLLSNLGLWDPGLGFPLAELSRSCPPEFPAGRRDMAGVAVIRGCDAHYLDQIADAGQSMELKECTPRAALEWLRRKKNCNPT